ncbi:UNVERIFIED_CONTAM: Lysophosphatidic acid receptor 3 [Gekko kuhli]
MNECHYDKRMDFFYNRSKTQTADEWSGPTLVIVLCFGTFFCLFIFISNSLVIAAVVKNKKFHFPFYYLLANLAAADFFAGIAYVFLMFNTGPVSKTLTVNRWFLRQGLLDTSLTASLANLLVIAVERHMSVVRMSVHSNLTKKRVTFFILLIWAIAIFMGAVPTLGWNCLCDISTCSSLAPIYSRSYLIFWTVSNLGVFFIMVVVYIRIYMYVQRKTNVLSPHTSGSMSRRRTPMKLMKTVMAVLGDTSAGNEFPGVSRSDPNHENADQSFFTNFSTQTQYSPIGRRIALVVYSGQCVPVAVKVFNAKVTGQMLYAARIWISAITDNIERLLPRFLPNILGPPQCVSGITLRADVGEMSHKAKT